MEKGTKPHIGIIGSGLGSLSAAVWLASEGFPITIWEQNWQPGGCTTSYWRKGYVFEAGATTVVGLEPNMPLGYILQKAGITIPARKLELPMQIKLADGRLINRYNNLEDWIVEAEKVFGSAKQRAFWEECKRMSDYVWENALAHTSFPPSNFTDLLKMAINFRPKQLRYLPNAFFTVEALLRKHNLHQHKLFRAFVNEQLLITAQNHAEEVNQLFGSAALCYTLLGNYYIDGGLLNLVQPLIDYLQIKGNIIHYRHKVENINSAGKSFIVKTNKGTFQCDKLISGIPLNNTLAVFPEARKRKASYIMESPQLNSAFQMGIAFREHFPLQTLHYQIHLPQPLPYIGSKSIFVSLNHPEDVDRVEGQAGMRVASVSTHIPHPAKNNSYPAEEIATYIIKVLEDQKLIRLQDIVYQHNSGPHAWQKWTGRADGFVGGYPQFKNIPIYKMADARLLPTGAYQCGDTVYPGQGIPGVALSGLIAAKKLLQDL